MSKPIKYIQNSYTNFSERQETLLHRSINVYIKDPLDNVSLLSVLNKVEALIPRRLLTNIEVIYVGKFDFLDKKEMNAMYKDSALYISNDQDDEEDMVDDIIHEIAHAVEEKYGFEIYDDDKIKEEFIGKRKKLFSLLKAYDYLPDLRLFLNTEYSKDFDDYLYKEIGYPKLEQISMNLFISPYSITSLREYFAIGLEAFFLNNKKELKNICPQLYYKIEEVVASEE